MKKRAYKILDLVFIFTSLILAGFLFWQFQGNKSSWVVKEKSVEEKNTISLPYIDKLTGLPSNQEEDLEPIVMTIMIDNNPESYPQSGLNEAKIVYDAQVEGGMTRFIAILPNISKWKKSDRCVVPDRIILIGLKNTDCHYMCIVEVRRQH